MLKKAPIILLLAASTAIMANTTFAASNQHIKLEGIEGDAVDDPQKEAIDVLAWSWGMSQSSSYSCVKELIFVKPTGKTTSELLVRPFTGMDQEIPAATLTVEKAGRDAPIHYMTIEFKKLFVSSVQIGGAVNGTLTDVVTLRFKEATFTYEKEVDSSGAVETITGTIIPSRNCKQSE